MWLTWGNNKRRSEYILIAAQNNDLWTSYVKAKIDNAEQNTKGRLCRETDETIKHIKNECNKLAKR